MKLRFAPSPTGLLHVGNIRTALFNFLLARQHSGEFYLRMDDTDLGRVKSEYIEALTEDLAWLGIEYNTSFKQSQRLERYDAVRDQLIQSGDLYPCYESSEELEKKRKRLLARGKPPIYDRSALRYSTEQVETFKAQGLKPHWRFKLKDKEISFKDLIRGPVSIHSSTISDPVLIRADGSYLYTLCSVIDDVDYNISHIVRGEDHVTNTAVQVQIFEAIKAPIPLFGHHPLLTDESGEKLSKRLGSLSIQGLRAEGQEPLAILSYLSRIGTSDPVIPFYSLQSLMEGFDISHTSQSAARFVPGDIFSLNRQILSHYSFEDIESRLKEITPEIDKEFWDGIKFNITCLADVKQWYDIVKIDPEIMFDEEDKDYIDIALKLYKEGEWTEWTDRLKRETGRKGKSLFMPLRKALTGMSHGPEMEVVIHLLGNEAVKKRLENIIK